MITNLFTELCPACELCGIESGNIHLTGTTFSGKTAIVELTEYGFDFYGDPADLSEVRKQCLKRNICSVIGRKSC